MKPVLQSTAASQPEPAGVEAWVPSLPSQRSVRSICGRAPAATYGEPTRALLIAMDGRCWARIRGA